MTLALRFVCNCYLVIDQVFNCYAVLLSSVSNLLIISVAIDFGILLTYLHIQEAQCDRARLGEKFAADTAVANAKREFDLRKSSFQQEVNQKVKDMYECIHASCVRGCMFSYPYMLVWIENKRGLFVCNIDRRS